MDIPWFRKSRNPVVDPASKCFRVAVNRCHAPEKWLCYYESIPQAQSCFRFPRICVLNFLLSSPRLLGAILCLDELFHLCWTLLVSELLHGLAATNLD